MGCADYRLYCDGDSDSDGNGIMYWVLNKKKRAFWNDFPGRLIFSLCVVMWLLHYTRTSNVFLRGSVSPPLLLTRIPPFTFSNSVIVRARALIKFCVIILKFLLLYIYCSESQRKDTAVFGDSQTFRRLLTEVMATGAGICDISATKKKDSSESHNSFFTLNERRGASHEERGVRG